MEILPTNKYPTYIVCPRAWQSRTPYGCLGFRLLGGRLKTVFLCSPSPASGRGDAVAAGFGVYRSGIDARPTYCAGMTAVCVFQVAFCVSGCLLFQRLYDSFQQISVAVGNFVGEEVRVVGAQVVDCAVVFRSFDQVGKQGFA